MSTEQLFFNDTDVRINDERYAIEMVSKLLDAETARLFKLVFAGILTLDEFSWTIPADSRRFIRDLLKHQSVEVPLNLEDLNDY